MGLLDGLLGSIASGQGASGGIGSALLGLLASQRNQYAGPAATPAYGASPTADPSPAAISGGLGELVQRLEQGGLGQAVQSWISSGPNQNVSPDDLEQALGPQTMDRLSEHTGFDRSQLLPMLAQALPAIVDRLTPHNRLPNETELAQQQQAPQTIDV